MLLPTPTSLSISFNGTTSLQIYSGTTPPSTNAAEVIFAVDPLFNASAGNIVTLFGNSATNTSLRLWSGNYPNVMSAGTSADWSLNSTYYVNGFLNASIPTTGQNQIDISSIAPIAINSIGLGYGCTSCNFR